MKKVCNFLLALVLMFFLGLTVFAEETNEPTENPSEATTVATDPANPSDTSVNPPAKRKKYKVIDIDLGDFRDEMEVGSSQLLSPTAIYVEEEKYEELATLYHKMTKKSLNTANDDEYQAFLNWLFKPERKKIIQPYYCDMKTSDLFARSFSSKSSSIVKVNALGRIQAVCPGRGKIQIKCGDYIKTIIVVVKEKTQESSELPTDKLDDYDIGSSYSYGDYSANEKTISVRDLDFGEYEKKLEVGKSVALNVSVIPSNATNPEITFYSSDERIATVNGLGRVTGVSAGQVKIIAKADGIMRSITLEVEVKTDGIEIDNTYVVMKPEENHSIVASVVPENAPQSLTYTSSNENVASVNSDGVITAVALGSTTIVVSNGSAKSIVSVIVNENEVDEIEKEELPQGQLEEERSQLAVEISNGLDGQTFVVQGNSISNITSDVLMALYGTNKTLIVKQDDYEISILGNDIVNIENELISSIDFILSDDGVYFQPNAGNQLPGRMTIILYETSRYSTYKWLYQYNSSLKKWQLRSSFENGTITIDTAGDYSLRQNKEPMISTNWWVFAGCVLVVLLGIVVYIALQKQYLFW